MTTCLGPFELVMSSACSLLFIFVAAPDPGADGEEGSGQAWEEQQSLGVRGRGWTAVSPGHGDFWDAQLFSLM